MRQYQICTKTIMDTSDPDIFFDGNGVSNHYYSYFEEENYWVLKGAVGEEKLKKTAGEIKKHGRNNKYDCIIGLSGGVDSTYLCLLAKKLNLRPLVIHFDNGWNSELAVYNIENTIKKLKFDLYTYVVDWREFRDMQRAYFKANVIDIEVLTDHAFMAVLYQQAYKQKIKYVLGGMNTVTEGILPRNWIGDKGDTENIINIQRTFGEIPIKNIRSFPFLSPIKRRFLDRVLKLQVITPLNWIDFEYRAVKEEIKSEIGWRDYGGKHYESVFTRFYQGFILPTKFGIDKRRAHLSTLVCSGQMTREEALKIISNSPYDSDLYLSDRDFVLKKLGFSEEVFEAYLKMPRIEHSVFGKSLSLYEKYPLLKLIRPLANLFFPQKI